MSVAIQSPAPAAEFPGGVRDWTPFPFMRAMREDPIGALGRLLAEQGGAAAGIQGGPLRVVVLARPEQARHVLIRNARNYTKGRQVEKLQRVGGRGVFFVDGPAWRRQRGMVVPAFQRAKIDALVPQLVAGADELLERWQRERAGAGFFDVTQDTSRVALDLVCRAMFSTLVREQAEAFHQRAVQGADYAQYLLDHVIPLPLWLPTARNLRMRESMRWARGFLSSMIAGHRSLPEPPDDLLGLLLRARDEETGAALSDEELYHELMTFVNAGHETTAVTLAWSLYEIGRDPGLSSRLEREVDEVLGQSEPTLASLDRLELLGRTIREVLRVHPPAWLIPRAAKEDDEIAGVRIPKHATAVIAVYFIHRQPQLWTDPERFDPDRFLPERGEPRQAFAYLPFGLGGRRCVGEDFAMLELRAVLARMLQRFRVSVDPTHRVVARPQLTLKPAHGVRVRLEVRA
jgi:cytochrome P450